MAPKTPTSPAQRYYIPPEGEKPGARPGGVSRSRTEPWQPRAERPGGWLNLHARKGVSTFGNTGTHRPLNPLTPLSVKFYSVGEFFQKQ